VRKVSYVNKSSYGVFMKALLQPFTVKSLQLTNRVVMAPMTRSKSPHHIPGDDVVSYYERRAKGGVGLIITEGTAVNHKAAHGYPDVPNCFGHDALTGWKRVVDAVHAAGGKIMPQLWHVGSVRQLKNHQNKGCDNPDALCSSHHVPGFGPSPVAHPYVADAEIPHEMTIQDIQDVIEAFAHSARAAKEIGFDGVEIHGAHGYLVDQFFWDHTNRRTDRYGGKTLAERTAFGVELVKAVRKSVGEGFPIQFRFSQWKLGDYEAKLAKTAQELESFLLPLARAGVDIFHCSTRVFSEPEFAGSTLNLAGWTKKITKKPCITVGSVGLDADFITTFTKQESCNTSKKSLQSLLHSLENEEYDLVAVGRALIGDAEWVSKVAEGRFDQIVPFAKEQLQTLD
jgi:2,4-dienoyl-CoA reductase-like NADH-dependent reductase (Old Yellow Enzyme family)